MTKSNFEKSYFEGKGSNYSGGYSLDFEKRSVFDYLIREFLIDYLRKDRLSVLDIGCATGLFLEYLKTYNPKAEICGVDISNYAISQCKDIKGDFRVVNIDKKDLPWKSDSMDIIVAIEVIEHLSNEKRLLENVYRCLKKNGVFLFSCPMKSGVIRKALDKDETHINLQDSTYYFKTLPEFGFEILKSKKIALFGWPPTVMLRKLLNVTPLALETRFDLLTQDQIYLCRKKND